MNGERANRGALRSRALLVVALRGPADLVAGLAWPRPRSRPSAAAQALVGPGSAVVTGFSGIVANPAPSGGEPFDYVASIPTARRPGSSTSPRFGPQGAQLRRAEDHSRSPPARSARSSASRSTTRRARTSTSPRPRPMASRSSSPTASATMQRVQHRRSRAPSSCPASSARPSSVAAPVRSGASTARPARSRSFANVDERRLSASLARRPRLRPGRRSRSSSSSGRPASSIASASTAPSAAPTTTAPKAGRRPACRRCHIVPGPPVDINAAGLRHREPGTWGFASPARRVFGLARAQQPPLLLGRAGAAGLVGRRSAPSGALAGSPRFEVEVPSLQDGVEIASIAFDGQGRMYLAERGATTGDYSCLSRSPRRPEPRAPLRAEARRRSRARASGGSTPDQYSIGLPPNYNNADGGVALGYGYQHGRAEDQLSAPAAPPSGRPASACSIRAIRRVRRVPSGDRRPAGQCRRLVQPQNMPPLRQLVRRL